KYTGTASVVITDGNSSTVLFTKSGISITSSNYDSNANGSFSVDVSSITKATGSGVIKVTMTLNSVTGTNQATVTNLPKQEVITSVTLNDPTYTPSNNTLSVSFNVKESVGTATNRKKATGSLHVLITSGDANGTEYLFEQDYDITEDNYDPENNGSIDIDLTNITKSSGTGYIKVTLSIDNALPVEKSISVNSLPKEPTFSLASEDASYDGTEKKVTMEFAIASSDGTNTEYIADAGSVKYQVVSGNANGEVLASGNASFTASNCDDSSKITTVTTNTLDLESGTSGAGVIIFRVIYNNKEIGTKEVSINNLPT
nr:hypothetical protein [Lachnospiraceae bacterium]